MRSRQGITLTAPHSHEGRRRDYGVLLPPLLHSLSPDCLASTPATATTMVSKEDASAAIGELIKQQSAEVRQTPASIPLNIDEAWACGEEDMKGKVVVVTGAGSGFGKGFSLKAGQFGCVSSRLVPSSTALLTGIRHFRSAVNAVQRWSCRTCGKNRCRRLRTRSCRREGSSLDILLMSSSAFPDLYELQTGHGDRLQCHQVGGASQDVRASKDSTLFSLSSR